MTELTDADPTPGPSSMTEVIEADENDEEPEQMNEECIGAGVTGRHPQVESTKLSNSESLYSYTQKMLAHPRNKSLEISLMFYPPC